MYDRILKILKSFLTGHFVEGKPLLIGFSGGPDSLSLLHLLIECKQFFNLDLQIAHVDHGWRPESREEAEHLKAHVQSLGLPFYLRRLENLPSKEDIARRARLEFFQELYGQLGCQALLLGHQGDDQSETVLKRILEGASFPALGGIRPVAEIEGMKVWRPLLKIEKTDLRKWLQERGLEPLEDKTNEDPRYLRGRMRTSIVPELSKNFGKEVSGNLRRLGESAQELADYLARRLKKYEGLIEEDSQEIRVDFSSFDPFEPFEIKAFLKKITEKNKIFLSHASLRTLYDLIEKGNLHRRVGERDRFVEIRGRRIAIKKN